MKKQTNLINKDYLPRLERIDRRLNLIKFFQTILSPILALAIALSLTVLIPV